MPRSAINLIRAFFSIPEIWRNVRLIWRLLIDPRVSLGPKMIVPATLMYVIFPIDLIPDLMPGLGQLDDLAVILIGLKMFIEMCPHHVVQEHLSSLRSGQAAGKHRKGSKARSETSTIEGVYRVVDDSSGAG